jgi:hypothetical protein
MNEPHLPHERHSSWIRVLAGECGRFVYQSDSWSGEICFVCFERRRFGPCRSASPRPADGSHLPALSAPAEEPIAAIGLEPRHADSGRHLEPLENLSRPRIDSPQLAFVTAIPDGRRQGAGLRARSVAGHTRQGQAGYRGVYARGRELPDGVRDAEGARGEVRVTGRPRVPLGVRREVPRSGREYASNSRGSRGASALRSAGRHTLPLAPVRGRDRVRWTNHRLPNVSRSTGPASAGGLQDARVARGGG